MSAVSPLARSVALSSKRVSTKDRPSASNSVSIRSHCPRFAYERISAARERAFSISFGGSPSSAHVVHLARAFVSPKPFQNPRAFGDTGGLRVAFHSGSSSGLPGLRSEQHGRLMLTIFPMTRSKKSPGEDEVVFSSGVDGRAGTKKGRQGRTSFGFASRMPQKFSEKGKPPALICLDSILTTSSPPYSPTRDG